MIQSQLELTLSRPPAFAPARILEIEIGLPLAPISAFDEQKGRRNKAGPYQRALAIIFLHDRPLGTVEFEFDDDGVSAQQCARLIWQKLHHQINEHLCQDGLPPATTLDSQGLPTNRLPPCIQQREQFLTHAPFVSIIVPTHDRPEPLKETLRSLLDLRYPRYEILVVDNAPSSNATYQLVRQAYGYASQIRYLRTDIPGVSRARNLGAAQAQGEIIAFTDDDVSVHPNWLTELVRGFAVAEKVGCVTGYLMPLELETPAQYWCEENRGTPWFQDNRRGKARPCFAGWPARRIFDDSGRHQHLYRIGLFGCGASMAFKASALRNVGGFDPALGGRGPSRCGQDVATLFRILMHGYKVVHEPASLLYHLHRREYHALCRQLYNYGVGLTAYLTKNVLDYPQLLLDLCTKVPYDLLIAKADQKQPKSLSYPKELHNLQIKGMLYGPIAFFHSRWIERKQEESEQPTSPRLPASGKMKR
ncbi:MAG TPA: glycosyltransferase [Ktedonosporobacter sp.]|jgi:GT2 family glycosyltransferase|nr:glycosyltransferase [Ktedonosporobacter sp.]